MEEVYTYGGYTVYKGYGPSAGMYNIVSDAGEVSYWFFGNTKDELLNLPPEAYVQRCKRFLSDSI